MTSPSGSNEWVVRMAEGEANAIVSVGGLAVKVAALGQPARSPELLALGKLVELRRREKGSTAAALAHQACVTEAALLNLERGIRLPNTRDVTTLVAQVLDLPAEKLAALVGSQGASDPTLRAA